MECYITYTASHLPGSAVDNDSIQQFLGTLDGEEEVREKILKLNGIRLRHYAQDERQQPTNDVYGLASKAVQALGTSLEDVSYLATGTTYAPLSAPGCASLVHSRLSEAGVMTQPVEISSHAGICSSAAAGLVGAIRAVESGQHRTAISVGAEHASEVLKSSVIRPVDDRSEHEEIRNSRWFMSVFLRFMLSDGAGACVLASEPTARGASLRVNWTSSLSLANGAPLCMKLDNANGLLTQDLSVLNAHLFKSADRALCHAMERFDDRLDNYAMTLPHLSSFFFQRRMERVVSRYCENSPRFWTNLATAGNTGAASIYVMLDEYLRTQPIADGDRILLFVPESGQFNFVFVSLTAVVL